MYAIHRTAMLALALAVPVTLQAQRGMGPRGPRAGGNPVAPIIDMRRELNLAPRQLVQLDSIERAVAQRNEQIRARLRARLDSAPVRRRDNLTEEQIQARRALADSIRGIRSGIVRNDSIARAAAMNVLTDEQRTRVRERLAERRGFAAGRASALRQGGQRGFRPGPGARGPGGQMRPGSGRMGMGGPGLGPQGRMRGPNAVGPRGRMRPPAAGFGPGAGMRRMGPPDEAGQGDFVPRRRGPMDEGGAVPPGPGWRFRQPPADSGR